MPPEVMTKMRGLERMRIAGLISEAQYNARMAVLQEHVEAAPPVADATLSAVWNPAEPAAPRARSAPQYQVAQAPSKFQFAPAPGMVQFAPAPAAPQPAPAAPAAPAPPQQAPGTFTPAAFAPPPSGAPPAFAPPGFAPPAVAPPAADAPPAFAPPGYAPPAIAPPGYGSPGQPLPQRPASRARAMLAGGLVCALLAGAIGVYIVASGRHSASSTAGTPATARPARTAPAAAGPVPQSVADFVPIAQKFVNDHRGLFFLHPVPVTLLDDAAFTQQLTGGSTGTSSSSSTGMTKEFKELRALHLISGSTTIDGGTSKGLSDAVSGFYDDQTKELYVRGTSLTPYAREVIVHELTHAVQDQNFGLYRPDLYSADDESFQAFQALYEGDARNVEDQYVASMSLADQQEALKESSGGASSSTSSVPDVLIQLLSFPYTAGPRFVQAVLAAKGQQGLDDAFRTPPTTTEQILHPERFLAGEGRAIAVTPPAAGGAQFDKGVLGEVGFILLFDELATAGKGTHEQALAAAAAWGGDRFVAWDQGSLSCVRVAVTAVTSGAQPALNAELRTFAGATPHATFSDGGSGPSTLTVCG